MMTVSGKSGKRLLGFTYLQFGILVFLGILFCIMFFLLVGWVYHPQITMPTHIPTLIIPTSGPPTPTPSLTPTASPTASPTETATSTPQATLTATKGIAPFPDTTENIHVAQIFSPSNPQIELGIIDFVWGSNFPTKPQGVYNTYYYPFDRDLGRGLKGLQHDLNWFLENHPDWIVYTLDRTTPAYEYNDPNVPLDITNPAVLDYMMQTYIIPAIQKGYQGIAFDNVTFYNNGDRRGIWRNGEWIVLPSYRDNIIPWAAWMYERLHALNVSVAMNFPYEFNYPDESNQIYKYLDIVVDERGFTNWGRTSNNYLSDRLWLINMQALQSLDEQGKGFVSINEMPEPFVQVSRAEIQWALANYLLVKGKHSFIAITGIQEYGHVFTTPEYSAPVGHAVAPMYESQGVYMRDYSNGKAIVNPSSSQTFTINLPPLVYKDLYGKSVNKITLDPCSGIVLLKIQYPR